MKNILTKLSDPDSYDDHNKIGIDFKKETDIVEQYSGGEWQARLSRLQIPRLQFSYAPIIKTDNADNLCQEEKQ